MQGRAGEGLEQIRQGMAACQAIGVRLGWSGMAYQLAEACGKAEQYEEGLDIVDESLLKIPHDGERCYETELYRLKGELTLQKEAGGWRLETSPSSSQASSLQPPASKEAAWEAEECFHKAIAIAQKQQAKTLELRATIDLANLWQRQGKLHVAYTTLAALYSWFTEGFDTKDLQEAKALLQKLNQ
jgi:tetratricopeptide (TPR) repeat protein